MTVSIRYDIDDAQVRRALDKAIAAGADLSPAMDKIGAAMVTSTQVRFERGVSPSGTPWLPSLRARFQRGRTLVDRGRLRDSITHVFGRNFTAWGTNVIYAAVHQFGATIRAKNKPFLTFSIPGIGFISKKQVTIPPRPFLGLDQGDRAEIRAILGDHLVGGARP